MDKRLESGSEARRQLKEGIDAVANHVKSTLGACGRNVLIQQDGQAPLITKDGVRVARNITFSPSLKQAGAEAVKAAAERTVQQAGDGTTTTCVLAQALYEGGCKAIDSGYPIHRLRAEIESAVDDVVGQIQQEAVDISIQSDSLMDVAMVSSNGDRIISECVVNAYRHVGANGSISPEPSANASTYVELGEGCRFLTGYINPAFINTNKGTAEYDNCWVYITDKAISNPKDIIPILSPIVSNNEAIAIIAPDVNMEALFTIVNNKVNNGLKVVCIKAPSFINVMDELLQDIACYVGGKVDSTANGTPAVHQDGKLQEGFLGKVSKLVVSDKDTMLIGGYSNQEALAARVEQVRARASEENFELQLELLKYRLQLLTGKSARIFVGGQSDMEIGERVDRIDDTIRSVKSALDEGVVVGAGVCLLDISNRLKPMNEHTKGYEVVREAIKQPFYTILSNAEMRSDEVLNCKPLDGKVGYNVLDNSWIKSDELKIIDSAKVVRCALQNAASVATMLLTTECTITNG